MIKSAHNGKIFCLINGTVLIQPNRFGAKYPILRTLAVKTHLTSWHTLPLVFWYYPEEEEVAKKVGSMTTYRGDDVGDLDEAIQLMNTENF